MEKIIAVLLPMHTLEEVQKGEMSAMDNCSDRNLMKFICTDAEKCTALFTEKIGVWNTQSLQGSVGIHLCASIYTYRSMKDVRYRSYMRWKNTGIPYPGHGNEIPKSNSKQERGRNNED
eukprot:8353493-Ditylum_brightwellii.AAC.1